MKTNKRKKADQGSVTPNEKDQKGRKILEQADDKFDFGGLKVPKNIDRLLGCGG
ncbi:hypothetical protein QQ008_21015 [Fulvivirgaceae bacterium BMA10]|uniref:Uncharacterized protein n=1 Tax=Splendidivirga corallicola TaxID=3051826 RepID=A0ABT8KSZ8_9BACT|nr:hypothetical protein [Fulvivirgaceae bacterium BMA10]